MSRSVPHLDADQVLSLVTIGDAIAAVREAFSSAPIHNARQHVALVHGDDMLMMPAVNGTAAGVKVVTIVPGNVEKNIPLVNAVYVLLARATGLPRATMDGNTLTSLRTPAASAIASDVLARPDVRSLGIFGSGIQARGHVSAMLLIRPDIDTIYVTGRTSDSVDALISEFAASGVEVLPGTHEQTAGCDIVCGCTSSYQPVIPTSAVRPGSHLNLVGSYSMDRRETDTALIEASSIYVDERNAASREAGELMYASVYSDWSFSDVRGDLVALSRGSVSRQSSEEITIFKSVGLAIEDLAVASLAADRAGL
ncbi:MAG: ornithine cyclodeaminase family protein [Acidimicrobiales bacterium]